MANSGKRTTQYGAEWEEILDGFKNRGWYIVTDDGRDIKPKSQKPNGPAPARKQKSTAKGFATIMEILENA